MNKILKDGLMQPIKVSKFTGVVLELNSINELMLCWYELSRDKIKIKDITYRGIGLKIVYDFVLDDEDNVIEETDFITIRKDLEEQIENLNKFHTNKDGE